MSHASLFPLRMPAWIFTTCHFPSGFHYVISRWPAFSRALTSIYRVPLSFHFHPNTVGNARGLTCTHMGTKAPVRGSALCGTANMSVPKTTADNRVIIRGQTDYTAQHCNSAPHVKSTLKKAGWLRAKDHFLLNLGKWKNIWVFSPIKIRPQVSRSYRTNRRCCIHCI